MTWGSSLTLVMGLIAVYLYWRTQKVPAKTRAFAPARISLEVASPSQWTAPVTEAIAGFSGLGYQMVGVFRVTELDFRVLAFFHPEHPTFGTIYIRPDGRVSSEFVARYEDGESLTVSNSDHTKGLEARPGHPKVYAERVSVPELFARYRQDLIAKPVLTIRPEEFAERFVRSYSEEIDWRNARGITRDEYLALAKAKGKVLSEDALQKLQAMHRLTANDGLEIAFREQIQEGRASLSESKPERPEQMVFVHDLLMAKDIERLIPNWKPGRPHQGDNWSRRRTFADANEALPASRRYRQIGTANYPVQVDIYVRPAN